MNIQDTRQLKKICIIDLGICNVGSVLNIINKARANAIICKNASEARLYEKIILPGVGKFDTGIKALLSSGFDKNFWNECIAKNKYILGICLGMQLFCRSSEEGNLQGLSLFNADCKRFKFDKNSKLKIPHMGWNLLNLVKKNLLINNEDEKELRYYFIHSYKVFSHDPNIIIATTNYGEEFCSVLQKDNIFGVQFHPEKSHSFGLELIKNFVKL
jgi:glutamine amidotransferase